MDTTRDSLRKHLAPCNEDEEICDLEPSSAEARMDKDETSTPDSPRGGPVAFNSDCAAPVGREEAYHCEGDHKLSAPAGMRLQLHSLERYALEKVPSPVRIKAEGGLQQTLSSEISPPPSPKRKRETGFQDDMLDVAFTAVLPPRKSDLPRSQSTF
jgi:hypothetical protein